MEDLGTFILILVGIVLGTLFLLCCALAWFDEGTHWQAGRQPGRGRDAAPGRAP